MIPALRGEWEVTSAHVRMVTEATQAVGMAGAIGATAQEALAAVRGDLEGAVGAAAALRATGKRSSWVATSGESSRSTP